MLAWEEISWCSGLDWGGVEFNFGSNPCARRVTVASLTCGTMLAERQGTGFARQGDRERVLRSPCRWANPFARCGLRWRGKRKRAYGVGAERSWAFLFFFSFTFSIFQSRFQIEFGFLFKSGQTTPLSKTNAST
jgi:hypothetical protein